MRDVSQIAVIKRGFKQKSHILNELYRFFHAPIVRQMGLKLRATYLLETQQLFGPDVDLLNDLKARFYDLEALEISRCPLVQLEIDWETMNWLKTDLVPKQRSWFKMPMVNVDIFERTDSKPYYIEPKDDPQHT